MMFYAKPLEGPEGTYEYHVGTCLEIVSEYLELHREVLERLCPEWRLTFDEFALLCRRAAFFHDFGKLGDIFQQNMRCRLEKKRCKRYFRHELLSARLLYELRYKGVFPYDVWAVLGHHKRLSIDWSSFSREKEDPVPDCLNPAQIEFGLNFSEKWKSLTPEDDKTRKKLFRSSLFEAAQDDDNDDETWVSKFLYEFSKSYLEDLDLDEKKIHRPNRLISALIRGILGYADWNASAKPEDRMCIYQPMNNVLLGAKIRENIEKKQNCSYQKRSFQSLCENVSGNILAIAPTGSGKTEASLLWATKHGPGKILFLMPTKVTSNSIYERMKDYFEGEDDLQTHYCGLSHSGAGVYFAQKADNDNIQEDIQNMQLRMLRQYKAFMAPVMVATVDQLLTANFNIGDWFFKELATLGASVVFDEIHAYESYTLALITESIKRIKKLGGRVMVMSATMPKVLREHFQKLLEVEKPIVAEELMERRKCSWEYRNEPLESFDEEILQALEHGFKIAIVVNTVKEAQRVFSRWKNILTEEMPQKNIMCYHSNFTMGDREEKEKCLLEQDNEKRPKDIDLLVATQVIEVSLDISFDLMLSECAPLDALIQRAGRCNRFSTSKLGRFIVFPISDIAKKYVYSDVDTILHQTEAVLQECTGKLSEQELSGMLERVYRDFELYDDCYNEGKKLVQYLLGNETQILDTIPGSRENSGEEFTTRRVKVTKIPVIPIQFWGEVEELLARGDRISLYKIARFEVPVVASRNIPITKKLGYLYGCEVAYDNEIGLHKDFEVDDVII